MSLPPLLPAARRVSRLPSLPSLASDRGASLWSDPSRAPRLRRLAAEIIDALIPLPFLAAVFPAWVVVPVLYHLFADARGGSPGKRLMGLRVVYGRRRPGSGSIYAAACTPLRSVLRNLGGLLAGLAALVAFLAPLGAAYHLIECLMAAFSPTRRRLGDLLAGTFVVAAEDAVADIVPDRGGVYPLRKSGIDDNG